MDPVMKQMMDSMMQTMNEMKKSQEQSQAEMQKEMAELKGKSDQIIRQNEELQENTRALGFFAAHVRALDGGVFQSAFGQLEGPQQQRVLAITDGTPVTPRANEGYKRSHNGMENGNSSYSTMFSSESTKKPKLKEVKEFTPEQLQKFKDAVSLFQTFLPPQVKGVKKLDNGSMQAAPVAGQQEDYKVRTQLIVNLLSQAVKNSEDQAYSILIQPYILGLLLAKYAKGLKAVKEAVDAFLSTKSIAANPIIDQFFNEVADDIAKVNSSKTIAQDASHATRVDYATRMHGFLTSEEAKAFAGIYSTLRNIGLLDSLYAEELLKNFMKDFAVVEAVNIIDKTIKQEKTALVGAAEMLVTLQKYQEAVVRELPNSSSLQKDDLNQAVQRITTLLDRNRAEDFEKLKTAFIKLNDLLTTHYTNKYTIDKFLTVTMDRWYQDNSSALETYVTADNRATPAP